MFFSTSANLHIEIDIVYIVMPLLWWVVGCVGYGEVVTSVINGGLLQAVVRTAQKRMYPYVRYLSYLGLFLLLAS